MKYYKVLTPFHKMKVEKKKKIRIAGSLSGNLLRTSYGRFRGEICTMGFGSAYLQKRRRIYWWISKQIAYTRACTCKIVNRLRYFTKLHYLSAKYIIRKAWIKQTHWPEAIMNDNYTSFDVHMIYIFLKPCLMKLKLFHLK